jgi:hypothetical protein
LIKPRDKSYRPDCPACEAQRVHTTAERMRFHPYAGHGYIEGQGWSLPELDPKRKEHDARNTQTDSPDDAY